MPKVRYHLCIECVFNSQEKNDQKLLYMGSSPGWAPFCSGLVTKQYNLVLVKGVISLAGKATMGLVESNDSLPLGL